MPSSSAPDALGVNGLSAGIVLLSLPIFLHTVVKRRHYFLAARRLFVSSKWFDALTLRLLPVLRNLRHHRSVLIIKTFDVSFHLVWRFSKWIWGTVIVGVLLLAILLNIAQYGNAHIDHPERWAIWLFVQTHIVISIAIAAILLVLMLFGMIAHRSALAHAPKQLPPGNTLPFTRVRDLDRTSFKMGDRVAATYPYIRGPVAAIFDQAAATVNAAAKNQHAKQGILVLGEANAGKTRLALESLYATIPDWEVIVWNEAYQERNIPTFEQLQGRDVVVFLDDLQTYASGGSFITVASGQVSLASFAGPSAVLRTLFERVCQDAAHVVFVATCRREDVRATEGGLGWLFQKLDTVEVPTFNNDEKSPEAQRIIDEFAANGEIRDEWDGTLGSLVLGLATKRQEYLELVNRHSPAVPVLHAMKLMTICDIRGLTGKRVHAVCDQILHETSLATVGNTWEIALAELDRLEFITITPGDDGDVTLTIRKDAYFERVITGYPADYQIEMHRAKLLNVLASLEDAQGSFNLAITFVKLGRYNESLDAFNQAVAFAPTIANYWYNKGTVLLQLDRHAEAIEALDQAIMLNPASSDAWGNKGTALARLGHYDEANDAFDQVLRRDPTDAKAWNNKGPMLFALGRRQEALDAFDHALALGGPLAEATLGKVLILIQLKRVDEALAACENALKIDPNNTVSWQLITPILLGLHRENEALAANTRAIELNPKHSDNWKMRGAIFRALGREDEACAAEEHAKQFKS